MNNADHVLAQISEGLRNETGMGGVCIWRKDRSAEHFHQGKLKDFLLDEANQEGVWLIDGGWGGPPGPIYVRWDSSRGLWENGGFGGHVFARELQK